MDITHITSLLGGVALFLYGMSIMGSGLERVAGGKMQSILQKLTASTLRGVLLGALIEALGLQDIDWATALRSCVKSRLVDVNLRCLDAGMRASVRTAE